MSFAKPSKSPRRIALVDCNNFYASCERVFTPAWERKPIGVLSNNDGCIIARSNELKEAGIPMGAPFFKYRKQLRQMGAVVVSSNYELYGDMSARVMNTLGEFTPEMEVYSIDEAWLDLTGFCTASLDAYGRNIVAKTRQYTGIPVSMGIGPTKVLAKVANRLCKKHKIPGQVFNIGSADALDDVLASVDVEDIWGIGRRWAAKLRATGIYTAKDLRDADHQAMRRSYNVVMERLILELRGVPCLGFEDIVPKKQIIASRSFGQRVTELEPMLQAISTHAARAGDKLRSQQSACGGIQVSIRTGKHSPNEPYYGNSTMLRFPVATSDSRKLISAACQGLKSIYRQGPKYAKAGVMLFGIVPANCIQHGLFQRGDSDKAIRLMQAVDGINKTYGRQTVFFASQGISGKQNWAMKRDRMSRSFTTSWQDLPVVC